MIHPILTYKRLAPPWRIAWGLLLGSTTYANILSITADHFTLYLDQRPGIQGLYEGHVEAIDKNIGKNTQHLRAEKLSVIHQERQPTLIAYGQPAVYSQPDNQLMAHAREIRYFPKRQQLALYQDAFLLHSHRTLKSHEIHYDLKRQILTTPTHAQSRTIIELNTGSPSS
jgi:lipopolysaccharide transport protein LptA